MPWRVETGGAILSWTTVTGAVSWRLWKRWWGDWRVSRGGVWRTSQSHPASDARGWRQRGRWPSLSFPTRWRSGYRGEQTRDHGVVEAERIVSRAQEELGISDRSEWPKGDWRKGLVAVRIRKRSLVDNGWLARRLEMGARTAVSRIMGQARKRMPDDRKAKALGRRLEREISRP